MALTRITKGVIKPNENYDTHNINSTGIVTAIGLDINGNGDISGNLSVGGVLTYEDVTSIDSVGIITAQSDIHVGAGVSVVGIVTAATFKGNGDFVDIDVDGHTNLDNVSVAGVTTITSTTYPLVVHADTGYQGILVNGNNAPTIGFNIGNNATPSWKLGLHGGSHLNFALSTGTGNSNKLVIQDASNGGKGIFYGDWHGTNLSMAGSLYHDGDDDTQLQFGGSEDIINLRTGGSTRLSVQNSGIIVTGVSTFAGITTVTGNTLFTEQLSVSGVTTFTSGNVQLASDSQKLQLGSGQDLWMYHTGTSGGGHGLIQNDYGTMYMLSDNFTFRDRSTNHDVFMISQNNSVSLFYQNNAKLSTTSTGAQIDTILRLYGAAGNPGKLILAESGATSEIRVERSTDTSSALLFGTEISGTTATRAKIDTAGHFIPGTDSDYDLGLNGTRWRNVYADTLYGDGSNLTGITQTTINSNADNRVITGSGTANTLNAESTLTYNASILNVISTTQGLGLNLRNTSNEYTRIKFDAARTAASSALGILEGIWNNGNSVCQIYLQSGDDTTNKDDGRISMVVNSAAGSNKTAFRIEPDASVQLPNDSQKLQFGQHQDLSIWHGGSNGYVDNETGDLSIRTTSSNTEVLRILSTGNIRQTKTGANANFTLSRNESVGTTNQAIGVIDFASNTGHTVQARLMAKTLGTSNVGGDLVVETRANGGSLDERLRITGNGNVNIGGDYTQSTYTMKVTGSFAATTKSFVIDHPTKENYSLRYACLEGPENSVYVRGKTSDSVIELPDYWTGLVHEDSITVNVTPIGNHKVWVESINNNSVTIGSDGSEYFYTVFAERKDVDKLEVEVAQ